MEITAEVHFAQRLACNQSNVAEKAFKNVGKWFERKSVHGDAFTEDSMLKLWKGLFYYFWNTDKPLIQEDKANIICNYIHAFKNVDFSFLYIDTFFQTMAREWLAIDRYRIEKFMMLVRRFLNQTYQLLKNLNWEIQWIKHFSVIMKKTVVSSNSTIVPLGLKMHISDIYMEELAKVAADEFTPEMTQKFLIPFCKVLADCDDITYLESISKDVFLYLINQDADEDCFHKFPILKFDAPSIQELLMKYAKKGVKKRNIKIIYTIIKEFENFKNNVSVLDKIFNDTSFACVPKLKKRDIQKAALDLYKDEVIYSEKQKKFKKKKLEDTDVIDL